MVPGPNFDEFIFLAIKNFAAIHMPKNVVKMASNGKNFSSPCRRVSLCCRRMKKPDIILANGSPPLISAIQLPTRQTAQISEPN